MSSVLEDLSENVSASQATKSLWIVGVQEGQLAVVLVTEWFYMFKLVLVVMAEYQGLKL